jgi:hypothetical protein
VTHLVIFTLAALGGWDILRRVLPVRLPVAAGEVVCFVIAYVLITRAPGSIVQALAVIGGMIIIATFIRTEPSSPWGDAVMQFIRARQANPRRQVPPERIGHRVPRL